MTRLWGIHYSDYDVSETVAIFTENDLAEAHKAELEKLPQNRNKLSIEGIEVDPPLPVIRKMAIGSLFKDSVKRYGKEEVVWFSGGSSLGEAREEWAIQNIQYCENNSALNIRIEADTEAEAKERGERIRGMIMEARAWGDEDATREILRGQILKE